jgi:hypothetical protein
MLNLSPIFTALLEEAKFTREVLGSGVTQIGKANYAQKGIYFQAFSNLSIGLERIGKLCLILDYYLTSNGKFPDQEYLKNKIGHDLTKLYERSKEIISGQSLSVHPDSIQSQLHQNIIKILSDFGRGDRYANINLLVNGGKAPADPIKNWHTEIDKVLFDTKVPLKARNEIKQRAQFAQALLGNHAMVVHYSEDRSVLNLEESSMLTGSTEAIAKFRRLYVLQIIRYWVEILRGLQYKSMNLARNDIPAFSEIFALFGNDDSYLLTRKNFEKDR